MRDKKKLKKNNFEKMDAKQKNNWVNLKPGIGT